MATTQFDYVVDRKPNELFTQAFEFVNDIPSGDSIKAIGAGSATTATAIDEAGTDVTATVVSSKSVSGTQLLVRVSTSTTAEVMYQVTAIVEMTTSGEKYRKTLLVRVGNPVIIW